MIEGANIRIGTAGWSIPRASAARFPGPGTHLERYARVLNCAEINSSFYRPHAAATYAKWRDSTPPDFRFAFAAVQLMSLPRDQRIHGDVAHAQGVGRAPIGRRGATGSDGASRSRSCQVIRPSPTARAASLIAIRSNVGSFASLTHSEPSSF